MFRQNCRVHQSAQDPHHSAQRDRRRTLKNHAARVVVALITLAGGVVSGSAPVAHAATYNYSYDNGGGGNTPFGGTQAAGTAIDWGASCKGPGTSRPGYTLLGFRSSYDSDVYGTDCGGGYFSLNGFIMPSEDVVFTFAWELNITYDSQGGTAVADGDTTTSVGATISALPTDPTRSGYTFAGWYMASSGGTQITTSAGHGQESHFTLYALWAGDALTISYDSQGGSAPSDGDTTTTSGGLVNPLPTPPTRSGYTFSGWNTAADGTGTDLGINVGWGSDGVSHGQTSDFTLYAQWTEVLDVSYDINYAGGSAVADGDATTTTGGSIATLPTDPTRAGYTFAGWYTASSGGTQITAGASHGQTSDFTLYAQWLGDLLNVTYDSQSGSAVADGDTTSRIGATISALPTDPTRSGYTFNGWYTASSGGTQITTSASHGQTSDFTLYAQWTIVPVASPSSAPTTALSTITVTVAGGASREVNHQTTRIETALEAHPGGLISVTGQHYERFSTVELWINSTPRLLAIIHVGSDNAFDLSVPIPSDIEAGEHTLQINGTDLDGNLQTTLIAIQLGPPQVTSPDVTNPETATPAMNPPTADIAPDPELPVTGGTAPASIGLILISCGMFLIAIRDRRLPFVRRDLRA